MNGVGRRTRVIAACVASSLFVVSCASTKSPGTQGTPATEAAYAEAATPEERLQKQSADFNQTLVEGAAVGAAIGGVLGAVTGLVFGGKRGALIGGAAGAGLGALAGGLTGTYYANKKEEYANQEQRLDAMIQDVKADNAKAEATLNDYREVAQSSREATDRIKADLQQKRISTKQAQYELAVVKRNQTLLAQTLAALTKRRDEWNTALAEARTDANTPQVAALESEVKRMDRQVAQMKQELDALNSHVSSVVG